MFSKEQKLSNSLVSWDKMCAITQLCTNVPTTGAIIEIGVWRGGVAMHLADLFPDRIIYLIDTFTGIPYSSPQDNYHKTNDFSDASFEEVSNIFKDYKNIKVLQGIFPDKFIDTFTDEFFAAVHLDVDVYKAYKDSLEFLYPKINKGGIIMLDDYAQWSCEGATLATDEFLQSKKETVQELAGQFYITKE